jgi:hypothetical protein
MEKRGFVQRTRSTLDKRRIYVKITDMGEGIIKQTPSVLQEEFKKKFLELKDWEQNLLLSSLQRVADMMESEAISRISKLEDASVVKPGDEEYSITHYLIKPDH